jgi:hypothetical protein
MNPLENYQKILDESDYDASDSNKINSDYQKVCSELLEQKENDLIKLANLEREVFGFQKSFRLDSKKGDIIGISWMFAGEKTLEDGTKEPLYWPDISSFKDTDFEYIAKRYRECNNLYAKTEFGILLFLKSPLSEHKHNDFKKELAELLFELSKRYLTKYKNNEKNSLASTYFCNSVRGAIYISTKYKFQDCTEKYTKTIVDELFQISISKKGSQNLLFEIVQIIIENFKDIKELLNIEKIFETCYSIAKETEKELPWSSMTISEMCIRLQEKTQITPDINWLAYKAYLFELLAADAKKTGNVNVIPGLIDNALSIYQLLKDSGNIKRLESEYKEKRGEISLTQFRQKIPSESVEKISDHITKTIAESNSEGILDIFSYTPMFPTIEKIKESVTEVKKIAVLQSIIPLTIIDRFGNKIAQYNPEETEYDSNFWQTYSFHFQLGNSILYEFFVQALKSGKLTFESLENYLSKTWLYEPVQRTSNNKQYEVFPKDTLIPPLELLFSELTKSLKDEKYSPILVSSIDSLTIKIEGLLRFFCEKIGIATFKRSRGSDLVMEKNLDELLFSLQHRQEGENLNLTNFIEEDRIFIKFYLSEKAGENLRNEVAHGLMLIGDYNIYRIPILLSIILKLSKYKFIPQTNENNKNS